MLKENLLKILYIAGLALAVVGALSYLIIWELTKYAMVLIGLGAGFFILGALLYLNSTETHYFLVVNANGVIKDITKKRISKTANEEETVYVKGKKLTISTSHKFHLIPSFAEKELEIASINVNQAIAEARLRKEEKDLFDFTVKSLVELFKEESFLLLLVFVNLVISGAVLVLILFKG